MKRGDLVYKVEVKIDNYGKIDYSVKSGICLGVQGPDVVVNLDSSNENIKGNWQLWHIERYYALYELKNKLENLLASVNADLSVYSEEITKKEGAKNDKG